MDRAFRIIGAGVDGSLQFDVGVFFRDPLVDLLTMLCTKGRWKRARR